MTFEDGERDPGDRLRQLFDAGPESQLDGLRLAVQHRQGQALERSSDLRDLPPNLDAHDLEQTGWGVIFGPEVETDARIYLGELLDLRQEQAGDLFKKIVLDASTGVEARGRDFLWQLARDSPGVIDLEALPYYVLLVGSPEEIPFHFQADLAVNRAVGRLDFRAGEELKLYAGSVRDAEEGIGAAGQHASFLPSETDETTREVAKAFRSGVFEPLSRSTDWLWREIGVVGTSKGDLLSSIGADPPGLLAVTGHGRSCRFGDPLQPDRQGALQLPLGVDSGGDDRFDYLQAADVESRWPLGEQPFLGMIAALFCCHSLGVPQLDEYPFRDEKRSQNTWIEAQPDVVALESFVARLPQVLLTRGALAVLGHVERGFTSSFLWRYGPYENPATRSLQAALQNLCTGHRVGHALRPLFRRASYIASHLLPMVEAVRNGWFVDQAILREQWVAYVDARNYMLLGDPAVYATGQSSATDVQPMRPDTEATAPTASPIFLPEALLGRARSQIGAENLQSWLKELVAAAIEQV